MRLVKVAVPSKRSVEASYLVVLTFLLFARTYLSIWLADVNGLIVKAIVNKSWKDFLHRVLVLLAFAIPASTVNSGLEYFQKKLAVRFRTRLTDHFHNVYLDKMNYYKICNLD